LTSPLDIPFVSQFYGLITHGDTLTPLSLFSLIVAVPTTIVYELLTGSLPAGASLAGLGSTSINWLSLANTFVMLLLIPLWIAGDLTTLPAPLTLAIAAATLLSIGLGFVVLNSQETEDFIMLCARVAAVSISVYGIGVAAEDQPAWAAAAPTV